MRSYIKLHVEAANGVTYIRPTYLKLWRIIITLYIGNIVVRPTY